MSSHRALCGAAFPFVLTCAWMLFVQGLFWLSLLLSLLACMNLFMCLWEGRR